MSNLEPKNLCRPDDECMQPIDSKYDVRLVTLIGVAISAFESLALETDTNTDKLLADHLYLVSRYIHEVGEEMFLDKLERHYPLLQEAIK